MQNLWENYRAAIILGGIVLIGLVLSIYIVPEEEQAVVLRTGEPVRVVNTVNGSTGAGLYLRVPLIESVRLIDKRLLDLEMTDEEVLSQDQQRLLVNAYARFRIVDPVDAHVMLPMPGQSAHQACSSSICFRVQAAVATSPVSISCLKRRSSRRA